MTTTPEGDLSAELDAAAKATGRLRKLWLPAALVALLGIGSLALINSNRAAHEASTRRAAQATAVVAVGQAQDGKALASEVAAQCANPAKATELGALCGTARSVAAAPSVVVITSGAPASGQSGQNGRNGAPGATVTGPPGPPGPRGQAGASGAAGSNGSNGQNGSAGSNGANGTGVAGPTGPPGPAGAPGTSGTDGAPGTSGTDGAPGTSGTDGSNGQPPASWTWTDPATGVVYLCARDSGSPDDAPTYTCTAQ